MILKEKEQQASSRSTVLPFNQAIQPSQEQLSKLQQINQ